MAKEISPTYATGATLYATIRSAATGQYYAGTAAETLDGTHWSTYARALTETSGTGQYYADFPALPRGRYVVDVYLRAGGSPATSDGPPAASGVIAWSGTAEVAGDVNVTEVLGATAVITTPAQVADAILVRDWTSVSGSVPARCMLNAFRFLRNHWKIVASSPTAGTLTVYGENDTTPAWTKPVVLNAAGPAVSEIGP